MKLPGCQGLVPTPAGSISGYARAHVGFWTLSSMLGTKGGSGQSWLMGHLRKWAMGEEGASSSAPSLAQGGHPWCPACPLEGAAHPVLLLGVGGERGPALHALVSV